MACYATRELIIMFKDGLYENPQNTHKAFGGKAGNSDFRISEDDERQRD
jgi:hypothetical protein